MIERELTLPETVDPWVTDIQRRHALLVMQTAMTFKPSRPGVVVEGGTLTIYLPHHTVRISPSGDTVFEPLER